MAMPSDDVADSVRSGLCAAAGKARHPDLVLWHFAADMDVLPDDDDISEDDVPAGERSRRSGAGPCCLSLLWTWWTGVLTIFS